MQVKSFSHKSAFTLIELLIVIVIIGILSGVVLVVINPQRIINRAKDSQIKGAMRKMAMILSAEYNSTGRPAPSLSAFGQLSRITTPCPGQTNAYMFTMPGIHTNYNNGCFYFYDDANYKCIATRGFIDNRWYAIRREGVLKSRIGLNSIAEICANNSTGFLNPALTIEN